MAGHLLDYSHMLRPKLFFESPLLFLSLRRLNQQFFIQEQFLFQIFQVFSVIILSDILGALWPEYSQILKFTFLTNSKNFIVPSMDSGLDYEDWQLVNMGLVRMGFCSKQQICVFHRTIYLQNGHLLLPMYLLCQIDYLQNFLAAMGFLPVLERGGR